jgi:hypothetical protein
MRVPITVKIFASLKRLTAEEERGNFVSNFKSVITNPHSNSKRSEGQNKPSWNFLHADKGRRGGCCLYRGT